MDLVEMFVNRYVIVYLLAVVGIQVVYSIVRNNQRRNISSRRRARGLSDDVMLGHAERLDERRRDALLQSALLLGSVLLLPPLLITLAQTSGNNACLAQDGLAVVFVALFVWLLFTATDVAKAFLGGLAFKTLVAFKSPFQVGDRVSLRGIGGKVVRFDTFFVTLQTPDDGQISIPSGTLWNEVLSSTNAGNRASLCVIRFYVAPFATTAQRQAMEDAIWESMQSSVYYDPHKPMQIFVQQNPDAIQFTAKAYIALTYDEPLFVSDVSRAVLDAASWQGIPLASSPWKRAVESDLQAENPLDSQTGVGAVPGTEEQRGLAHKGTEASSG